MHDYFEILGVSPDARAREIRQAGRRRASAPHPDFCHEPEAPMRAGGEPAAEPDPASAELKDAAIDFVDMASVVARMQAAFFGARTRGE